ncbi:hypothetical protein B10927_14260 [Campylobacter jejuni]|nr:hypothetical protein B10927_14260 [Campylobacter jejuni]
MDILKLAIKDFLSLKFLKFALIPLIFSLVLMLFLGVLGFSALLNYFILYLALEKIRFGRGFMLFILYKF